MGGVTETAGKHAPRRLLCNAPDIAKLCRVPFTNIAKMVQLWNRFLLKFDEAATRLILFCVYV